MMLKENHVQLLDLPLFLLGLLSNSVDVNTPIELTSLLTSNNT